MPKFNFITRDWKEQLDTDVVNELLESINEPVKFIDVDDSSDQIVLAICTRDLNLSDEEWTAVYSAYQEHRYEGTNFPDHSSEDVSYIEISESELRNFLQTKQLT